MEDGTVVNNYQTVCISRQLQHGIMRNTTPHTHIVELGLEEYFPVNKIFQAKYYYTNANYISTYIEL
jgi:hypothetical protein